MPKVSVSAFSLSLDGFGAGPKQSLENPVGLNGTSLHEWAFKTRTFKMMFGQDGGETGVDDQFAIAELRKCWRLDHGSQHVWTGAWRMVGRKLERLVGR